MLEVLLVTGPLGAGKTTVVNRLLKAELARCRRVAVLVNEFGAVSVDGVLVAADRPEVADIANLVGGCVCCSLRPDVVAALAAWCDQPEERRPERVVLETTGLADPIDLVDLETEPALAGRMRLAGCLTVISALTPMNHLESRALLRRQAALASLVYISKADLDPSLAWGWESQVRAAFRDHPVVQSRQGLPPEGAPDPWSGVVPDRAGAPAGSDPDYAGARALTFRWDHPVDPAGLEALFRTPLDQGELLRAKGVCSFADWPARHDGGDRWAFQWADGRLDVSPLPALPGAEPAPRAAVVIGLGLAWDDWRARLRTLERPPAGVRHKLPRRAPAEDPELR